MTTKEIITSFMKGNSKVSISGKQKNWLINQSKNEGYQVGFDGFCDMIYMSDCFYSISQCKRLASGGSYVGTKLVQDRYNIEKMVTVRFTDTGNTFVYNEIRLEIAKKEGFAFDIIPPHVNTNTRR